ncbi:MAG: hypothetical protein BroJett011_76090 [Chloroflexota bacterium]|nr:MAG: hypothetical protein BroJett011_76090 [Chloroflexota bacterium]
MSTQKPTNEVVIAFGKDSNGCVIITLFDVHGDAMKAEFTKASGLEQSKLAGKAAIAKTGVIGEAVKALGLVRKHFNANGHNYYSYTKQLPA